MSEIYLCPVQTIAGRMYEDPEPPEFCWNEVENEGDLCAEHEDADLDGDDYYND